MTYFRDDTLNWGFGFGWEGSRTSNLFYIRLGRWHHEWAVPR